MASVLALQLALSLVASDPAPIWGKAPGHVQGALLVGLHDGDHFGSLELQASASALVIGVAVGLGYFRLPPEEGQVGGRHGARVELALQLRPVLISRLGRFFDLYLTFGGFLGGVGTQTGTRFRGATFVGAGLDLPLTAAGVPLAFSICYRRLYQQSPGGVPPNLLAFGLAWRHSF